MGKVHTPKTQQGSKAYPQTCGTEEKGTEENGTEETGTKENGLHILDHLFFILWFRNQPMSKKSADGKKNKQTKLRALLKIFIAD